MKAARGMYGLGDPLYLPPGHGDAYVFGRGTLGLSSDVRLGQALTP
ncbi:hypothetical protein AB0D65_26170 [Streptomyces griseoloalbus]|uniref:Uncharacterized protein n=1 Tax=Streptomyces griseoloalbus TaxID=67303 RepID=A0ABV3EB32_9ACTN